MYARDLPNDAQVSKVDGGADFTVLYRVITSLYDGYGATTILSSPFSSTGKLLRRGTGVKLFLTGLGVSTMSNLLNASAAIFLEP